MIYEEDVIRRFNKRKDIEVIIKEKVNGLLDKYSSHINNALYNANVTQNNVQIYCDNLKLELTDILNDNYYGSSSNIERIVLDELEANHIFISRLRGGIGNKVCAIPEMYVDVDKLLDSYNKPKGALSLNLTK